MFCLYAGDILGVPLDAALTSPVCVYGWNKQQAWLAGNREAFGVVQKWTESHALQDQSNVDLQYRPCIGLYEAIKASLTGEEEAKRALWKAGRMWAFEERDLADGQSKHWPGVVECGLRLSYETDVIPFARRIVEDPSPYIVMGQSPLGIPLATNIKVRAAMEMGLYTPELFLHRIPVGSCLPKEERHIGIFGVHDKHLTAIHNGYAFGGARSQHPIPEFVRDCSDGVGEHVLGGYTEALNTITTSAMLTSPIFTKADVKTPQDIKPGMVLVYPGHTATVFGTTGQTIVVFEYNRHRGDSQGSGFEGFGFRVIEICPQVGTSVRVKKLDGTPMAASFLTPAAQ